MKTNEFLKGLCQFPHRGSTTLYERKAAEYIKEQLLKTGLSVKVQKFLSEKDCLYTFPLQIIFLFFFSGILSLLNYPVISTIIILLALVMVVLETKGSLFMINFSKKYPSQNIICHTDIKLEKPTIVISGHYDTQKASALFAPKILPYTKMIFNLTYLSFAFIILGVFLQTISLIPLLIGMVLAFLSCCFFFYCFLSGKYTEGANDNATGTALTMAFAEYISLNLDKFSDVNWIFLATGAEETGSKGMKAFIKKYQEILPKESSYFLILDNLGSGQISYLLGEGMIFYHQADPKLVELAAQFGIQNFKNLFLPTDSLPLLNLNYKSISFLGKDENGNMENYHWHTDIFENINPELIIKLEEFFQTYINKLYNSLTKET